MLIKRWRGGNGERWQTGWWSGSAIASYANVAGGGVPLTNNTPASIIDYDLLAIKLGDVINNKEVIVVASKVTKQQETDAKVAARAKI